MEFEHLSENMEKLEGFKKLKKFDLEKIQEEGQVEKEVVIENSNELLKNSYWVPHESDADTYTRKHSLQKGKRPSLNLDEKNILSNLLAGDHDQKITVKSIAGPLFYYLQQHDGIKYQDLW